MKKFSLKPLGNSCIDILCKSAFLIGLLMTFGLAACSDDDDNTVAPVFPEKQNIICNAGDTREFTFTANTNWSLASSAIWCKFKTDDMEEFTLSGAAGTQTVTLMITDDNQKVDNISVAKLELTMGGQTIVIGEVTRSAVDYELTIYDQAGNEIQELEVGYDTFIPFKVKANFRFAATNLPNWIALEGNALVGPVNQEVKGGLKIIQDGNCEKYPVEASDANMITFSDETGKAFFAYKVVYKGMAPGMIDITAPSTNQYGWTVSLDGRSFAQEGNTNTYSNRLPFTIKTLNDDYEIVFIEKGMYNNSLYLMDPEYDEWMRCEGEKGDISLIVSPLDPSTGIEERVGYVLALSRTEYEKIKGDLEGALIDGEDIAYEYQQSALLVQFTQKEIKKDTEEKSFLIKKGGWEEITCSKVTDSSVLDFLNGNYTVKDVYSITAIGGDYLVVNPLLSEEEWFGNAFVIDQDNNDVNDVILEPNADENGRMQVEFTLPETLDKNIFIIFIGADGVNKKALMITPN